MDNAVALVQAYLRLNGYFTVAEYPVIASHGAAYRTATDLDVLAVRFPHVGQLVPGKARTGSRDEDHMVMDPALGVPHGHTDMIFGEVKEGKATLNQPATDAGVIRAALVAFGCCAPDEAPDVTDALVRTGRASLPHGHAIRYVVFAAQTQGAGRVYHTVSLGRVVQYLRSYVRDHWEVLRHWDSKEPALGFLITLAKANNSVDGGIDA